MDDKRKLKDVSAETIKRTPTVTGKNPLLSDDLLKYVNYRIEQEEMSSRLYLSMSLWLNNKGYMGASKLWKTYSEEEQKHADWSKHYLLAMGVQPTTCTLNAPQQSFLDLPDIIRKSFDHEIEISIQCKDLATEALKKADHLLYSLALLYCKEQIEECDKLQTYLDKLDAFGTDKVALRLLDNEMGQ